MLLVNKVTRNSKKVNAFLKLSLQQLRTVQFIQHEFPHHWAMKA